MLKKKAPILRKATVIAKGRMIRKSEMPAAFIAVSSTCSAKLPKQMSELSNIAKGKANGTTEAVAYRKNSARTEKPIPFPTRSVTCIHMNCINKIKIAIKKVAIKSHRKFRSR